MPTLAAGVGHDGSEIDAHDVTIVQNARTRDAVHDLVIHADADHRGIPVVTEERRLCVTLAQHSGGNGIKVCGGDARFHGLRHSTEGRRNNQPCTAHHAQLLRRRHLEFAGAAHAMCAAQLVSAVTKIGRAHV